MFEKILESQGMTLVKSAMKKFLKPEDLSLLAWKNEKGEPEFKIFQIDMKEYILQLEAEKKSLGLFVKQSKEEFTKLVTENANRNAKISELRESITQQAHALNSLRDENARLLLLAARVDETLISKPENSHILDHLETEQGKGLKKGGFLAL